MEGPEAGTPSNAIDLAAVFAALPAATGVFAVDPPRFTVLAASDALVAASGRPRGALVGRPLAEAFPTTSPGDPESDGLAVLRASLEAAVRTGAPQRIARQRYDIQRADGAWEARYWDAVNIPVREAPTGPNHGADGDADGGASSAPVRYVLHQTDDVTARVQSDEAAARAELRAERILERMGDAHCVLDPEFRLVRVNAAAERLLGVPRAAVLGRSHWETFPGSEDAPVGRAYRRVVADGVEEHLTHHYVGAGYDLHLEVDAYPTDEGGVAVFWRDVTAETCAEAAARAAAARDAYRVALTDALRRADDPVEAQATATHLLGDHLGASRVLYGEADAGSTATFTNHREYRRDPAMPTSLGRRRWDDFGAYVAAELRAGRTLVVDDVRAHPGHSAGELAAYAAVGIGAYAAVPLVRDGRIAAYLAVNHATPHAWTAGEVALIAETAERTWAAVERARAEAVLRASEARQAFLLALGDALRPLADPVAIQQAATRLLGEHLRVDRCAYADVHADGEHATVHRDYHRPDVASFAGTYRLAAYGADILAAVRRGEPLAVDDLAADLAADPVAAASYAASAIRAFVAVPLVKQGRFVALLTAQQRTARRWTPSEAALVADVAERTWAAVERARAEAALRDSEAKYRTIFDSIDEGFSTLEVLYDDAGRPADLRYREINPAFERHTGLSGCVGRTVREILPTIEDVWIETYARVARTGEPLRFEQYNESTGRWFDSYLSRVGPDGSPLVASVFTDVTARKRADAALQASLEAAEAARREAEAANRTKGEFLATMSHELRTPLNAIGGYAELIELGIHGPVTDAQRTALDRIQRSQRHLLGLIAGVLDYSRVEAGAVTYQLTDVPVAEAVAEAETLVAPQLRAKGLGYAWSGAAPELRVRADREKLQQILLNLLGNAIKFTDARDGAPGRIEVACAIEGPVEGGAVAAGATGGSSARRVRVHIRDTGAGIAADEIDRIFAPFVQADQRLTRPHAGVGLGLAISRDLARGMGGDLTAESTPGVGSTFTVTLPAA